MSNKAAQLAAIYAQVPRMVDCKGECWRSCGPVVQLGMPTPYEYARLKDVPRTSNPDLSDCELLENHRCSAYELRPFICRLWGTTPTMRCPYGCFPERWLSPEKAAELHRQVIALSGSRQYAFGDSAEAIALMRDSWFQRGARALIPIDNTSGLARGTGQ